MRNTTKACAGALLATAIAACSGGGLPNSSLSGDGGGILLRSIDGGDDAPGSDADGSGTTPGDDDAGGDASSNDDATAGDAADDGGGRPDGAALDSGGADGSGTTGGDASSSGPPPPNPTCATGITWAAGVALAISTANDDIFGSVTYDEQTIAWSVTVAGAMTIHYADASGGSFGAALVLDGTPYASDRPALSPDGLRLVLVNSDRQGFTELTRTGAGEAFGPPSAGTYAQFAGALAAGNSYGDPVLSADDRTFFYSVYAAGNTANVPTIFQTGRTSTTDNWSLGFVTSTDANLEAQGPLRRRPTGISTDELTLFYWDEVTSSEHAVWFSPTTGATTSFVDLGSRSMAQPTADCSALYYSAAGTSSIDLFRAPQN